MSGFFRGLGRRLTRVGYREVGRDPQGNVYFQHKTEDSIREVEFPKHDVVEAHDLPLHPLWNSWLRHRRKEAPSDKEVEQFDEKQRVLAVNVAELELKDRKLKLKEERDRLYDDSDFESEPIESLLPAQRVMFGQSSENQNAEAETANDKDVVDEWKP